MSVAQGSGQIPEAKPKLSPKGAGGASHGEGSGHPPPLPGPRFLSLSNGCNQCASLLESTPPPWGVMSVQTRGVSPGSGPLDSRRGCGLEARRALSPDGA